MPCTAAGSRRPRPHRSSPRCATSPARRPGGARRGRPGTRAPRHGTSPALDCPRNPRRDGTPKKWNAFQFVVVGPPRAAVRDRRGPRPDAVPAAGPGRRTPRWDRWLGRCRRTGTGPPTAGAPRPPDRRRPGAARALHPTSGRGRPFDPRRRCADGRALVRHARDDQCVGSVDPHVTERLRQAIERGATVRHPIGGDDHELAGRLGGGPIERRSPTTVGRRDHDPRPGQVVESARHEPRLATDQDELHPELRRRPFGHGPDLGIGVVVGGVDQHRQARQHPAPLPGQFRGSRPIRGSQHHVGRPRVVDGKIGFVHDAAPAARLSVLRPLSADSGQA